MIKPKPGGKSQLYAKDGSRPLGPVTTKSKAIKQEVAIKLSQERERYGNIRRALGK
jgi:hypothetical protein